jgi:hypothetical protein
LVRIVHPQKTRFNQIVVQVDGEWGENVKREIEITKIADKTPVRAEVLAITGMGGVKRGLMSQIPTFVMLPYGKTFQEMWSVRLDGEVCRRLKLSQIRQKKKTNTVKARATPDRGSLAYPITLYMVTSLQGVRALDLPMLCQHSILPKT